MRFETCALIAAVVGGLVLTGGLPSRGQANSPTPLAFDTASVKPSRSNNPNSNFNLNDGAVSTENVSLDYLLKQAFGLSTGANDQIVGAPAWVKTETFDIRTTLDDTARAKFDQLAPAEQKQAISAMLKALLQERFGLKAHLEQQPRSVLALVAAKHGPKLQPATHCEKPDQRGCGNLHNSGGHIEGIGVPLTLLANILATQPDIGGRTVVDDTNLKGLYSFDLQYAPESTAAGSGLSLFAALEDQLGLKLQTARLPVSVLVVDQINQPSPD